MTEERRYLTHDDYPDILLPCYITSTGEVWQWSNREKKMTKRTVIYDKIHDKATVNLINDKNAKHWSRSIPLATNVYRHFAKDIDIKQKIHHLGYRDGDVMNCNIDNLYKREERYNKNPRVRKTRVSKKKSAVETPADPDIFGLQTDTMTGEKIRHLTHDDFPTILLPCYITSTGEVYQYSKRYKKVVQRKPMYDSIHNKAVVNLANDRTIAKYDVRPLPLATAVYRYFSGDANIGHQLNLDYRDGDCMNCNIDNLFQRVERYNKHPRSIKGQADHDLDITEIYGLQHYPNRLVLSDFDSVMVFFDMKKAHPQATETKLTIDTTDWTAEQLRKLLKMRKRLDDVIIK